MARCMWPGRDFQCTAKFYLMQSSAIMFATMDIRLLTAADAESFWHLRLEALRNDPASFADSAEEHLKTRVEMVKEILGKSDPASNFVVGVFEEGKLTATAGFYRYSHIKERHKGHIWGVYVRPESRGKGAASELKKEIIHRARALDGLEQITLVTSANLPAQRLYKALGFESYGLEPHSLKIGKEYIDDVLMILRF
ncbi:MAG TPA: GNAT family N-acetyltransferase [Candidatus Acidoferrales bacterium]|nr:GNAT family N-acetyltransferase [Candidatus Acidoferrales bacterium]